MGRPRSRAHRVLRAVGKGTRVVLVPLPPAVGRAIDRASGDRTGGPILLNTRGARMDRHAATRRLRRLAAQSVVRLPRMHPDMLRHTFVSTMLDAGVDLRDVQIAARHTPPCAATEPATASTDTPTSRWGFPVMPGPSHGARTVKPSVVLKDELRSLRLCLIKAPT